MLRPNLEDYDEEIKFKGFIPSRDFIPGENLIDNVKHMIMLSSLLPFLRFFLCFFLRFFFLCFFLRFLLRFFLFSFLSFFLSSFPSFFFLRFFFFRFFFLRFFFLDMKKRKEKQVINYKVLSIYLSIYLSIVCSHLSIDLPILSSLSHSDFFFNLI
ncbi:TLR5 [Acanthosepion pharaonis]|uniref:TLR5 n=1 Tax=Acanthosepion pharaonis TaxID=158019 RepID=A0A812CIG5_ACAPH|nr:TLR5 [Sepia pharaonis]